MGSPKALLAIEGIPMAARVVAALRAGGVDDVVIAGGDPGWAAELGERYLADDHPGSGPLAALATALANRPDGALVVVAPCDQPDIAPSVIRDLIATLADAPRNVTACVVRTDDGRLQPLPAAWRSSAAMELAALVSSGERRAGVALEVSEVVEIAAATGVLADIDTPADLARRGSLGAGHKVGGRIQGPEAVVDVPEIDVAEAARRHQMGTPIYDVREESEYSEAHVPGAPLIPLGAVADNVGAFTASGEALIICRSGARSMKAAEFLRTQGIDAINIAGGTLGWIEAGFPVDSGA